MNKFLLLNPGTPENFSKPSETVGNAWLPALLKALALAGILLSAGTITLLKLHNLHFIWYSPLFQIYSVVAGTFMLSRVVLSSFYREPTDQNYLPKVSIVIAVKNEQKHIRETIQWCYRSRYPSELREVIVVDDGSTDKTWEIINGLQTLYPSLRVLKFDQNKGKRYAMAAGAEMSEADVLVYVDSDSFVEDESLYKIVQPFVDPTIGAVAGHIKVIIEENNLISKMESIRYYISHRLVKAAESLFGAVTCCSGAFSAYRRDAVMNVLPDWLNQTFLGTQATFGDDRSLTNFILRTHRVIFHAGAVSETWVPDTWSKFFRQQLRWKKSWSRETLVASRILYRKHPIAAASYYAGVFLTLLSPMVVIHGIIFLPVVSSVSCFPYLAGLLLSYFMLSLICYYQTQSAHWYYGIVFAVLYVGVLAWQNYYAMVTVNRTYWGTR